MKNSAHHPSINTPVAIIGIGCFFPKASGLKAYWRLLFHGIDAITDVPDSHWSIEDYFDADPKTKDKIYCARGGFLSPIDFDPAEYGIPPNTLEATDTSQLLGLVAAKMALDDAGYGETGRAFNHDRTSVILGVTGTQELVIPLGARLGHPKWRMALKEAGVPADQAEDVVRRISSSYVSWQENSFPGLLGNVVAGRISNRLDLGGTNCVVDAACASSMSAIHLATLELTAHRCDMALTGGVDTLNDIFMHMCFGQTGILSPTGDIRPFSGDADGTLLGEGVGIIALKRLVDAERDNDRIYAVIRAVGTSSDGRSQSIYAPRKKGQVKALRMAYDMAEFEPSSIDLIEAHGTGTRVGDQTEFQTLTEVFSPVHTDEDPCGERCALGTVKSMIGHTKAAAGTAGLIKTALALHHKTLPPTLKATVPDPDLHIDESPFYLNNAARPWMSRAEHPRRSAVSAFGFGGSNFHMVLEEHDPEKKETAWDGSVEIIALSADTPEGISDALSKWAKKADQGLTDEQLAVQAAQSRIDFNPASPCRLLFVLDRSRGDDPDLKKVIDDTATAFKTADPDKQNWTVGDIFFGSGPISGKLAFVFPGQGSQYVDMARDLMCIFPETLDALEHFNRRFEKSSRLSDYIYPCPTQNKRDKLAQEERLRPTDIAQPAIGAVSLAMYRILSNFGISPAAVCGHSYGELAALLAGGWMKTDAFCRISIARGRLMAEAGEKTDGDPGTMMAVKAPLAELESLVETLDSDVILANRNSPNQGVLSGSKTAIEAAEKKCRELKFRTIRLPVSAAFHSHLVAEAQKPFRHLLEDIDLTPTDVPVFSNTTGQAYPSDITAARDTLGNQILNPVDFVANVENQYEGGVQTFVEVGPKTVLTGLIRQILRKRNHTAIAIDASSGKRFGLIDLAKCLCHLAALGYPVQLDRWEDPPPSGNRRKPIMRVSIGGANYGNPQSGKDYTKKKRLPSTGTLNEHNPYTRNPPLRKDDTDTNMNKKPTSAIAPMKKQQPAPGSPNETATNTLNIVREGLKSMREIQARTASAHELFLKTQAEASRVLQSLMSRTRDMAQTTGIIDSAPETSDRDDLWKITSSGPGSDPESLSETEIFPTGADVLPNEFTDFQTSAPAGANPPAIADSNSVVDTLFEVISELTGYPTEMLNPDMNIEADLGIDSIKRVEIFSTMEERMPDLPSISPEDMGELKTLGQIAGYLSKDKSRPSPVKSNQAKSNHKNNPTIEMNTGSPLPVPHETDVESTLLDVISELTGYPVEMLKLDMNIEADLGIDSIKRVEILSTMEERMPDLPSVSPEDMGELKTLGQIVHHLTSGKVHEKQDKPVPGPDWNRPTVNFDDTGIKRRIVTVQIAKSSAPPSPSARVKSDSTIVITEDGTGLSNAIAAALSDQGIPAAVIPTDPDALKQIHDPISGFIPVLPPDGQIDFEAIRQVFLLAKAAGKHFLNTTSDTHRVFAAITRMDGAFGFSGKGIAEPLQGALPGLIKTAAIEWPGIHCRAIDVVPAWDDHPTIARAIVAVLMNPDPKAPLEIGLHPDLAANEHYLLSLANAEFPDNPPKLSPEDVIVVSGGARGITAAAVITLARQTGATFALLGRSSQPAPAPDWIGDMTDAAAVKKAILANEFNHRPSSPAELEEAFRRHTANHEINQTLDAIKSIGVKAAYYPVDVTSADKVNRTLEQIRLDMGPVAALIHGAGILQDRLIVDKRIEAFDQVFDTKVKGMHNLLHATRKDPLRYLILFSSVSARFGNGGQVDYTMANEVLNKIAQTESIGRPDCKVTSINWGPWEGGMVTPALQRVFEQRGIGLIPA
ncbi:MAG: SDR family NAD(P)-dependent oxidoreductase, partial [Thermodesulfobacteriota bacterium]|nr:SDR family NAD(P)-dependent oxidoreductase [Thermodesulfobacteriota bacterium]